MVKPGFDVDDLPGPRSTASWWFKLVVGALLTVALLLGGGYLAARYVVWPNIDRVATHYANNLEQQLGVPLRWASFSTEWTGWRPSLTIDGLRFGDSGVASEVERLSATLALRPMLAGKAEFHAVVVQSPTIRLAHDDERIWLAALGPTSAGPAGERTGGPQSLGWLLQQPDVRVAGATVILQSVAAEARPLRLEQVALVLQNGLTGSNLRVDVGRGGDLAASLALQGEVSRGGLGGAGNPAQWSGDLRLEARRLSLASITARLPGPLRADLQQRLPQVDLAALRGMIDPTVSATFGRGRLQDLRLRLRGDQVSMGVTGQAPVRFARGQLDGRWMPASRGGGELTVGPVDLVLESGSRLSATAANAVAVSMGPEGRPSRAAIAVEPFDLAPWLPTIRQLLPATPWLDRITAAGRLSGLKVDWAAAEGDGPPRFSARGDFAGLSLAMAPEPTPTPAVAPASASTPRVPAGSAGAAGAAAGARPAVEWPALRNLSGQFEASASSGQLTLRRVAGEKAPSSIRFGGVLAEPEVAFDELDARLAWVIDRAAGPRWLTIRAERFNFANADGRGSLSGRYLGGTNPDHVLDLRARIERLEANRLWRYLPVALDGSVRNWVRDAFPSGRAEAFDIRWSGDLASFPYRLKPGAAADSAAGQFTIAGKVRDVMLQYAPGWPAVHGIHGDLVFDRASMRFNGERGTVFDVPLSNVVARIDDLFDARLGLTGQARGDAAQFLKFVVDSPLGAALGAAIAPIQIAGASALDLDLRVPIREAARTTVNGRVSLSQGRFALADTGVVLEEVQGDLAFTQASLDFERVAARLHGRPVDLAGRVSQSGSLQVKADGRVDTGVLTGLLGPHPIYQQLRGSTPYQATVDLADGLLRLQVDSDLVGLASRLPAPLNKSPDVRRPSSLTLEQRSGQRTDRLVAAVGGTVAVVAERARKDARAPMLVNRAAVAVNRQPVLPDQGLSLQVTEQRVDLDAWIAAIEALAATGTQPASAAADASGGLSPLAINLVADELRAGGRNFNRVVIGASRDGDQWNANIAAREINGFVNWQGASMANGRLQARLSRLEIPQSERTDGGDAEGGSLRLPALDIKADRFLFGGIDLGALTLLASNPSDPAAGQAWTIDRLHMANPGAEFEARGVWQRSTRLDYTLKVIDAGVLLERFQIPKAVRGGSGTLAGRLEWEGSPLSIDRAKLGGDLDIEIRDGQFLKVEPGAAKLIGVLNLQALPKLLSLDFRHVFGEGFAFNELRGQARIIQGVATTDSLAMRGVQAVVQIQGEANLKTQTQNLRVVILPELNAGLASLAFAALVNPAVGLGTLLAQTVFSESLSRAFAYEIDVAGSWAAPTVTERRRERFGPPENQ